MEWDKMYTGGDIRMTSLLPSGKERIDMSGTYRYMAQEQ